MPAKGRKRLTEADLEARVRAYCRRHDVRPTAEGLPPFPAGQRETAQHREWLGIYKLHHRLGRRARGQCERCSSPASEGSIFCDAHRGAAPAEHVGADERRRLLEAQGSRCPICDQAVGVRDAIDRPADGPPRGLLHATCSRLAALADSQGPEVLERLRAYLWPMTAARRSSKRSGLTAG